MIIVVTSSILAVIITLIGSHATINKNKIKYGLEIGFIIVTIIACIHYDYGNDYISYYREWNMIRDYSWQYVISNGYDEVGWIVLNKLFSFENGFYCLVALLNIIQNYIYYTFIKKYVDYKWQWFALLTYLFTTSLYLINFSMMRQGLTVALFVLALMNCVNKKYIKSLMIILFASTIHVSAIICLPILFFDKLKLVKLRFYIVLFTIAILILYFNPSIPKNIYNFIITSFDFLGKYDYKYGNRFDGDVIGVGYLFKCIPYFMGLLLIYKKSINNEKIVRLICISILSLAVTPFEIVSSSLITRVSYYFISVNIVSFSNIYKSIENKYVKYCLVLLNVFLLIITYIAFFENPIYHDYFSEFKTIFGAFS